MRTLQNLCRAQGSTVLETFISQRYLFYLIVLPNSLSIKNANFEGSNRITFFVNRLLWLFVPKKYYYGYFYKTSILKKIKNYSILNNMNFSAPVGLFRSIYRVCPFRRESIKAILFYRGTELSATRKPSTYRIHARLFPSPCN